MSEKNQQDAVEKVAEKALSGTATFEQLRAKPRRVLHFDVHTTDEDGEELVLKMKFKALSSAEYDKLVEKNPPAAKDKQRGAVYNVDTFAPALIAAVSVEPKLTEEQATEIYNAPEWSGGEITTLFMKALQVCNAGLDVPFNERG